ncbi:MAG: RHS repeat domain-containing protein [Chloroflexota bacterium]
MGRTPWLAPTIDRQASTCQSLPAQGTDNGLQYFLTDHLGSLLAVTDASGTLTSQQRYLPFGQVRADAGAITQTDFGYTFQRSLPETGLMDYDARFYLPALGRFSQPDTLVPGAGNPQEWNKYSYTLNNPIRYNDPTGHFANILVGAAVGAIAGAAMYAANAYVHGNEINGTDLAIAAGVGAAAGALIGSGVGATAGFALVAHSAGVGMATSAIGYTLASGKNYKTSEMAISALVGGVAGAASGGVSSVFAKPLPLNYKGCLSESGRWFAKMGIDAAINASANVVQTVGADWINKKSTSREEIGASIIFGGGLGTTVDMVMGPGWGGFGRAVAQEIVTNVAVDKSSRGRKPISREDAIARKLLRMEMY